MKRFHIACLDDGELYCEFEDIEEAPKLVREMMVEYSVDAKDLVILEVYGTLVVKDSIKLFNGKGE